MTDNYRKYSKAERLAWGKKMAEAKAAKAEKTGGRRTVAKGAYRETMKAGGGPMKTTYRDYYKYAPKNVKGSSFNDRLLAIGNGMATNLMSSIPGLNLITGSGDYKVSSNTLMRDSVPQFGKGKRSTRIRHREYITDVVSGDAGSFNIQVFTINPGLSGTFPWLASVGNQYEEYKIRGMIFEFKTMSADALNSTNTALGQVIMATQYNVLSQPFINKQQMENYEFAGSTKPSMSLIHPVECEPHETPLTELFIRANNQSTTGSDARIYDFGKFYIATNGLQAANVNLGELWVSYDIEFFKPKLGNVAQVADHYRLGAGCQVFGGHYFNVFDDVITATTSSNFETIVNANSISIPESFTGQVYISYFLTGNSVANITAVTATCSGNATLLKVWNDNTTSQSFVPSTGSFQYAIQITVSCNGGGVVTFSGGTLPGDVTNGDLFVIGMPVNN